MFVHNISTNIASWLQHISTLFTVIDYSFQVSLAVLAGVSIRGFMYDNKSCPQCLLTELLRTLSRRSPSPDDGHLRHLKFLRSKCSCRVKHDIYGVAQHHNEWDILSISIMAHTLLPHYNTTNIQVHCHISCSVEETQPVLTIILKASLRNRIYPGFIEQQKDSV